jgi:hypothetical protein
VAVKGIAECLHKDDLLMYLRYVLTPPTISIIKNFPVRDGHIKMNRTNILVLGNSGSKPIRLTITMKKYKKLSKRWNELV